MSTKNSIKEEVKKPRHTKVDCVETVEEYIDGSDWRIKANANTGYSAAGLINNAAGKIVANHWLDEVYSADEGAAHRNGDYHIHDLDSPCPYCFVKGTPILVAVEEGSGSVSSVTIEQMMERQQQGLENRVVSWDFDEKNYVIANAYDVRLTRKDAEIVKVKFCGCDEYYCTPDHKFLLSNETWKEAQDLVSEDYLHNLYDFIGGPSSNHIISVEPAGRADVYCMTVDTHHNFCLGNGVVAHNCCGHDLQRLLDEGFNGVAGRVSARPPKHFREALNQMANFVGILQSEWAGAQAFSSFDTYLAPILFFDKYYEGVRVKEVRQALVNFVYNLNVPSRWGQSPFSNITIDIFVPEDLKEQLPTRGGLPFFLSIYEEYKKEHPERLQTEEWKRLVGEMRNRLNDFDSPEEDLFMNATYALFQPEMEQIITKFFDVMNGGDDNSQPFTFPIPTVNVGENFQWDTPVADAIFYSAAKYGLVYFGNYIGNQWKIDENGQKVRDEEAFKISDTRSMCCRLQLNLKELRRKGGGLFGSDSQTGSIGVVTINMARLGYRCKGDEKKLYEELDKLLYMAKSTLEKKRKFVQANKDRGLYPYTARYIRTFDTFFSTIGVNGMNEMIRNFTEDKENIATTNGVKFAKEVLTHIRERAKEFQEETGNLYNLEATPAEGTAFRMSITDRRLWGDKIIQAGTKDMPYYTNSSQLPVSYTDDPFEALDLQDDLQCCYTGGTVLHLYMSEPISSVESCKNLVRKVLTNYRLPYISITPSFSICEKHGYIPSHKYDYCPHCDQEIIKKHREELS